MAVKEDIRKKNLKEYERTSWPDCPPVYQTEMSVSNAVNKIKDNNNGINDFKIYLAIHFEESCPNDNPYPPVCITTSDHFNQSVEYSLSYENPSIDINIPAGNEYSGLKGTIAVDYTNNYIYFEPGSMLLKPIVSSGTDFNLDNVVICDWGGKGPLESNNYTPIDWSDYLPIVNKKITIRNVLTSDGNSEEAFKIDIKAEFVKDGEPEISLEMHDHVGQPVDIKNHIHLDPGECYSGIDCKISIDKKQCCVCFKNSNGKVAKLIKPKKQKHRKDFVLSRCRIFDWKGQAWVD